MNEAGSNHNKPGYAQRIQSARLLVDRLERLSADSYWAHQASGLRGSLLRSLEQAEANPPGQQLDQRLERLVERGFEILSRAARELRGNRH